MHGTCMYCGNCVGFMRCICRWSIPVKVYIEIIMINIDPLYIETVSNYTVFVPLITKSSGSDDVRSSSNYMYSLLHVLFIDLD